VDFKNVEKLKAEDDLFKQTDESAVFCFTMLLAAGSIAAFGRYSGINFEILKTVFLIICMRW